MKEIGSHSQLLEHVYDAACDATFWPGALAKVCAFVDGCAADLSYHNVAAGSCVTVACCWGEKAIYSQLYIDTYAELNPLLRASALCDAGTVHALAGLMPLPEFQETRFYREWADPQGLGDVVLSNLERTATSCATVTVRRRASDGPFDEDAISRLRMILPHMRRAASLGRVIDAHKASTADLSKTFDGLAAAVLLVSSEGQVVFANGKAAAMVARGEILRAQRGRLSVVDSTADRELRDAIADARRDDAGVKGRAIALASYGTTTHVAYMLPLTRRGDLANRAVAALFVWPVVEVSTSCLEVLAKSCRLTASEMRVLDAVIGIGSVGDLADHLGVTRATVKTHLNHLFAKTGTRRQSDLIRLATRYASPLIP